ncbi:MAG: DUF3429 domain-containing protein [Steroidobacteraceae bacterium]
MIESDSATATSRPMGLHPRARLAGYLGLLPFMAALLGAMFGDDPFWWQTSERLALGWGAAILGYVSAVHWGLALAGRWPWTAGVVAGSTLPSVLAAVAVVMGGDRGLALLVAGFGIFWLYEHRRYQQSLPADYLALRRNLSLVVCALLTLTAMTLDTVRVYP